MTIDTLARRRLALLAQREDIDAEIKNIDAQLIDAVEVGGHVDIDGQPVFRVQQRRRGETRRRASMPTTEPYAISIAEAADRLGVSKSYLYQLAKEGRLPVVRLGRRVLVPVESLQELLTACDTLNALEGRIDD